MITILRRKWEITIRDRVSRMNDDDNCIDNKVISIDPKKQFGVLFG
jgi:hypothetical protein